MLPYTGRCPVLPCACSYGPPHTHQLLNRDPQKARHLSAPSIRGARKRRIAAWASPPRVTPNLAHGTLSGAGPAGLASPDAPLACSGLCTPSPGLPATSSSPRLGHDGTSAEVSGSRVRRGFFFSFGQNPSPARGPRRMRSLSWSRAEYSCLGLKSHQEPSRPDALQEPATLALGKKARAIRTFTH